MSNDEVSPQETSALQEIKALIKKFRTTRDAESKLKFAQMLVDHFDSMAVFGKHLEL